MPDIIRLLPEHVANQIAAGEVVQRPSSAVKELLENSIDAGATNIRLSFRDGGKTYIQIVDNGKGMSETDARMCWERHATSKISKAEDLFKINTFGFRGEAMASIAAVAQVELKTRRAEDELGTFICIEGSDVKKQEPVQCSQGTSLTVKNLFYNIPARRNFLKSNPVETRHIIDEFQRVALAWPEISFSLFNHENVVYELPATTQLQRIADVFSIKNSSSLLAADEESSLINISGFVSEPASAKKTRGEQFFFVNRRYIRDPYLNHAVLGAYEGLIARDSFPLYVLFMEIDPSRIDVNVHPGKTEIKFEDERSVYIILKSVVKKALGQYTLTPNLDEAPVQSFNPLQGLEKNPERFHSEPTVRVRKDFDPFANQPVRKSYDGKWQELFEPFRKEEISQPAVNLFSGGDKEEITVSQGNALPPADDFIQVSNEFILVNTRDGIIVLDQQSAHQRILYEKYLQRLGKTHGSSQQLLFPRVTELQAADFELVIELIEDMRMLGFDISEFGKNSIIINGVPPEASKSEAKVILEGMLENYKGNLQKLKLPKTENLARSMAQQSSIKSGQKLGRQEMSALYSELMLCKMPAVSPSGQATYTSLTRTDLSALFRNKTTN